MKLFSQSIPLQGAVILAIAMLLWRAAFAAPPALPAEGGGVLYGIVAGWFANAPLAAAITALVLVVTEGLMLNLLLADHSLTPQNSLLPTLLYVICMSAPATTLTPMVLANAVLIVCTRQLLLKGTLLTISTDRACTATAMIGLSSMFYLPSALLMASYMLAAINYRLYSWKDWAVLFLGFLAPYAMMAIVMMFTGGLPEWWQSVAASIGAMHVGFGDFTLLQALGNGVLLALLVAGVASVWSLSGERTVVWQKNATTMLVFIVGAMAMLIFTRLFTADMQFFAIPFAFCVTCLLTPSAHTVGRKKRKEWVYTALLILTFIATMIC